LVTYLLLFILSSATFGTVQERFSVTYSGIDDDVNDQVEFGKYKNLVTNHLREAFLI
jgi:hypothetical protein